ncbi:MAG: M55 family metallopeptidase [Proteobacteria bacterium]|nr:M55 family metallopeptidase [Pseudomonadota bacterium]
MKTAHPLCSLVLGLCATVLLVSAPAQAKRKLKVYISVDMEGVVGAVTEQQLGPKGFEYQRFREFMTNETNAAIKAAYDAGATEILVSDSHGNGQNLLIERLPASVQVVRSWPRPLMMMQGMDATFDAAIFLGYHTSTSALHGVRAHTLSSARLAEVRLNGVAMSEASLNAAVAGHFNVPVVLISGDDATVNEARSVIGPVEGAVVKWAYSFHSARSLTPQAAYKLIGRKVRSALRRLDEFRPYKPRAPLQLDVRFKNYRPAQVLALLPIVDRTDSHSIRYRATNVLEVFRFLEFMLSYNADLAP